MFFKALRNGDSTKRPFLLIATVVFVAVFITNVCVQNKNDNNIINAYDKIHCVCEGKVKKVSRQEYGGLLLIEGKLTYNLLESNTFEESNKKMNVYVDAKVLDYINTFDTVTVRGIVRTYETARNDGSFDAKLYYDSLGIKYRISADSVEKTDNASNVEKLIGDLRNDFLNRINDIFNERDAGFVSAMIVGDKYLLDEEQYELYQRNGIAHILAISGLHISFIAAFIYKFMRRLMGGFLKPFFVAVLILLLYAVMTGDGLSVKRAVIMCIISMGAQVLGRTYDAITALSIAFCLLVLENPCVIFNSGFQLSFLAVAGVCIVAPAIKKVFDFDYDIDKKIFDKISDSFTACISINLSTLSVIMYNYYEFPMYSILINIIILPIMSLLFIAAMSAVLVSYISFGGAHYLAGTVRFIISLYDNLCINFEKLPLARVITGRPDITRVYIYYGLLVLFVIVACKYKDRICKNHKAYKKLVIIPVLAIIILNSRDKLSKNEMYVDMLDVGQGDCILVRNSDSVILFDGGSSDKKNTGEKIIYPLLKSYGIMKLDYICISHTDSDHVNGIIELMDMQDKYFKIENIVLPQVSDANINDNYTLIEEKAKQTQVELIYVKKKDIMQIKNSMNIKILNPDDNYKADINSESAVYKLEFKNVSVLFTGDIDYAIEKKILKENLINNKTDEINLLKVAHHGSASSSSKEFVNKAAPDISIISCGVNNSYGHPSKEVLERISGYSDNIFVTADCGQISIRIRCNDNNRKINVRTKYHTSTRMGQR